VLDAVMRPERNLEIQSSVIKPCVGVRRDVRRFCYLAPFFGVPSIAFYSERNFYLSHLHMALHAFEEAVDRPSR